MTRTRLRMYWNLTKYQWRHPIHLAHYWWNQSRFTRSFDPFISSCHCCCSRCEKEDD